MRGEQSFFRKIWRLHTIPGVGLGRNLLSMELVHKLAVCEAVQRLDHGFPLVCSPCNLYKRTAASTNFSVRVCQAHRSDTVL